MKVGLWPARSTSATPSKVERSSAIIRTLIVGIVGGSVPNLLKPCHEKLTVPFFRSADKAEDGGVDQQATYFIPVSRFDELVDFLQRKIEDAILGKRNRSRGHRNYETFDEFQLTQAGD